MIHPIVSRGLSFYLWHFLIIWRWNTTNSQCWHVWLMLSEQVLTQWWHPVASSEALDLLHWGMHSVLYRRIAMAIKMVSKVGTFHHRSFVCCRPGGCQGNTKWVVAQWGHPVASGVALDMLHWAMPSVSDHHTTTIANKMASNGGTFVCCCHHFHLIKL